jgi:DNA-directed RNA polymerase subunit RPC12/RpoP
MNDRSYVMQLDLEYEARYRYRCNRCKRTFLVTCRETHESGNARCPACLGDDVKQWVSRRDRLMRFLMLYEAA